MEMIEELYEIIINRRDHPLEESYVSSLLSEGEEKIISKIEEEVGELIDASRLGIKDSIVHEAADLIFHLLILLASRDISPEDIHEELKGRRK